MVVAVAALLLGASIEVNAADPPYPTWQGGGTNWSDGANWSPSYAYGQLQWTGGGSANSWNNLSSPQSQWRFYFSGGTAYTLGGNQVNFYDWGGTNGGILSDSTALQSINMNLSFEVTAASQPMFILTRNSGGLTFGGSVNTGGNVTALGIGGANTAGVITFNGALTGTKPIVVGTNSLAGDTTSMGNTRAVFAASNNYTGTTTVANGALTLANSFALGDTSAGTTVNSGAALYLSNGITVATEALTLAGTGISSDGALRSVSGSNAYTGLITASSATTYFGAATNATLVISNVNSGGQEFWVVGEGTTIVAGGATNSGSGTAFVKTNAGTAILAGSNAWSGNEYVRQGTVVLSNNNALGTGGTTYLGAADAASSATATLTLGSGITNSNAISVEASGTGARTLGYQTASGTGTQLGSITNNGTNSLAFNIVTNGTLLFGGGVTANGTNRLAVDGGGTLIVTNAGTGIANSTNYQVRIGNGTLVIGAGTIIARTNVAGLGHALDLGVDLSNNIVNATSTLAASNGVTVSNSIYVSTTNNSARVLSVAGAGTATYSGPIALNNANLTVNATNASDNVNITGAITNFSGSTVGNNGIIKTGAGTLALYAANTFGGTIWVNQGVLRAMTNANALGTNSGASSLVLNGGNLELIQNTSMTFGRNTVLSNNASITIDASIANTAAQAVKMGTLTMAGAQTLTLVRGGNYTNSGLPTIAFGAVTLGASGAAFVAPSATAYLYLTNGITGTDASFSITNEGVFMISNTIATGAGSITKNGAGELQLKSSNSFTGGLTVSAGKLLLGNNSSLGTGALTLGALGGSEVGLSAETTATTNAQNNTMVWNSNLRFGAAGGTGSFHLGTGAVTLATNVSVNVNDAGRQLTVGGVIGGAYSLTKSGGQTLTLTAANTYSGGTFVTGGALVLSGAGSLLSTGSLALTNGNFDISGIDATSTTIGSLASSGSIFVNLGSKTLTMGGNNTSTTFNGTISNTGSIVKEGSGTMTLGAANTYSGTTTINAGTLRIINAAGTLGTGNVTNNSVLDYDKGGMFAVSNVISGTGILRNIGTGTLVLMSSNSYIGGTVITNGAIIMSNNSALGIGTVTLGTPNVGVTLGLGNGVTNSNAISVVPNANASRKLSVLQSGDFATQLGSVYLPNTNAGSIFTFNVVTNATLLFGGGINVATNATTYYGRMGVEGGGTVILTNNGSATTNLQAFQMRIGDGTLVIGAGALNGRTDTGSKGIDLGLDTVGVPTSTSASLYASNGVTVNESVYVATASNTTPTRIMGIAGAGTATFGGIVSLTAAGLTVSAGSGGTVLFTNAIINNNNTNNATNTLTKIGAGTVVLYGTNSYSGTTTISEGELAISGVGIFTNTTGINLSGSTSRFDISGITPAGLTNGNASLSGVAGSIINLGSKNLTIGTNTSTVFAGSITNSGSLTKVGTGTLVLSGSNSYSGGTLVQAGTLVLSNNNALGAVGGVATLGVANSSVNSTLVLGDGVVNSNAINVSIQAAGYTRTISVQSAGQTASQLGDVTLNSSRLTFNVATNSTMLFGGGVNIASGGTGSAGNNLWLYGGGTLVVTNNGSVATSTNYQATVYDGTLVIGSGSLSTNNRAGATAGILLGAANFTTTNASSLYVSNGVTVDSLVWVNGATNGAAPTQTIGVLGTNGAATFSAGFGVGNTALRLNATNDATLVVSGNITNVFGNTNSGIIKTGGGKVVLGGTNTYTNYTTVSEGTLVVNGKIASLTNSVTNSTAVLSGSGSVAGTTTIEAGGTISPGNNLGTLSVTNLVFGTNGNYNWQIYNATGTAGATNGYDTIAGAGSLSITANASDKFNINLWTLSGLGPETNGSAINFLSSSNYTWTLGTWASISGFDTNYFNINTNAINGTGGFANAFTGTFSLTSSNNSIFLNYAAGASGIPTYSAASGTWSTNFSPALYQGAANWVFDGASGGAATNDIASATVNSLGTLTFSNTAGSYTLSAASGSAGYDAASALAITGNIVNNSSNAQTINLALGFSNAATIDAAAGHMTFGGAISNGTSLTFTGASNNTVSGAISGAGYLVKDGAGTLTLSGNNTYTGGTLVSTGTLQVGAGGTSGSLSTSALTNNATLIYNRSDNVTASYDISGTGALIKDGAGTLTLSGNNSYGGTTTISNGAISISILANAGSNSGIGTNATVTLAGSTASSAVLDYTGGNVATDRNFAVNNGGGTINMASSNTVVTLTGTSSGSGTLVVSEGTLVLSNTGTPNAFSNNAIQVDTGATLQLAASNQIGNTTGLILNGGTFRTGTSSAGYSDTLGTLTLSASSTIDLGSWTTGLRTLTFADSSAISWTGTLTITNWQGVANQSSDVAQILFGTGGLTSAQLGQIVFANQGITGGELIGGGGELVPIPEPRVYAAAVALLAAVGWRERKRVRALLKSCRK